MKLMLVKQAKRKLQDAIKQLKHMTLNPNIGVKSTKITILPSTNNSTKYIIY
jgi:hypothetical protein